MKSYITRDDLLKKQIEGKNYGYYFYKPEDIETFEFDTSGDLDTMKIEGNKLVVDQSLVLAKEQRIQQELIVKVIENKILNKYKKELELFVWGEVEKNKDGDLTTDEINIVKNKIDEIGAK